MKQKSLNTLYAYWNELRAGRLAPKRLEVEPSRIAGLLSETFMLERVDASNFQYRLAGTRLCELFGTELRSTNFLTGWSEADQPVVARQLSLLCEQGAVIELGIEARGSARRPPLLFDALLLPLLHTGNTVGRIIGAMCLTSPAPLVETDVPLVRHLASHSVIWPDGRPHSLIERAGGSAPFRSPPVQPAAGAAQAGDRPRLRVLDGGRAFWKPHTR